MAFSLPKEEAQFSGFSEEDIVASLLADTTFLEAQESNKNDNDEASSSSSVAPGIGTTPQTMAAHQAQHDENTSTAYSEINRSIDDSCEVSIVEGSFPDFLPRPDEGLDEYVVRAMAIARAHQSLKKSSKNSPAKNPESNKSPIILGSYKDLLSTDKRWNIVRGDVGRSPARLTKRQQDIHRKLLDKSLALPPITSTPSAMPKDVWCLGMESRSRGALSQELSVVVSEIPGLIHRAYKEFAKLTGQAVNEEVLEASLRSPSPAKDESQERFTSVESPPGQEDVPFLAVHDQSSQSQARESFPACSDGTSSNSVHHLLSSSSCERSSGGQSAAKGSPAKSPTTDHNQKSCGTFPSEISVEGGRVGRKRLSSSKKTCSCCVAPLRLNGAVLKNSPPTHRPPPSSALSPGKKKGVLKGLPKLELDQCKGCSRLRLIQRNEYVHRLKLCKRCSAPFHHWLEAPWNYVYMRCENGGKCETMKCDTCWFWHCVNLVKKPLTGGVKKQDKGTEISADDSLDDCLPLSMIAESTAKLRYVCRRPSTPSSSSPRDLKKLPWWSKNAFLLCPLPPEVKERIQKMERVKYEDELPVVRTERKTLSNGATLVMKSAKSHPNNLPPPLAALQHRTDARRSREEKCEALGLLSSPCQRRKRRLSTTSCALSVGSQQLEPPAKKAKDHNLSNSSRRSKKSTQTSNGEPVWRRSRTSSPRSERRSLSMDTQEIPTIPPDPIPESEGRMSLSDVAPPSPIPLLKEEDVMRFLEVVKERWEEGSEEGSGEDPPNLLETLQQSLEPLEDEEPQKEEVEKEKVRTVSPESFSHEWDAGDVSNSNCCPLLPVTNPGRSSAEPSTSLITLKDYREEEEDDVSETPMTDEEIVAEWSQSDEMLGMDVTVVVPRLESSAQQDDADVSFDFVCSSDEGFREQSGKKLHLRNAGGLDWMDPGVSVPCRESVVSRKERESFLLFKGPWRPLVRAGEEIANEPQQKKHGGSSARNQNGVAPDM